MEKPNKLKSLTIKTDKKKVAVNLANGGGIGVCIVFIGGALATATLVSALTIGRRLLKSRNNKNRNHGHSPGSNDTLEKFIAEDITASSVKDETKGLQPFPTDMDQSSSHGTGKTSMTEKDTSGVTSSKSFFKEEKQNLELLSAKGDLICDDKKSLHMSGLNGSDGSRHYDGSVVKMEEFPLPVVEDQTHFQSANMKEDLYGGEIEIIEEESISKIPGVHHNTEEDSRLMPVNNEEKVREVKFKEVAVIDEADQSALIILQPSEEQESTMIDHGTDNNSRGCLPAKSSMSVKDILVPHLYNSSLCKYDKLEINFEEGFQVFETVQTLEGAKAVKAVLIDKSHGNGMQPIMEEKEKSCNQCNEWPITEHSEQQKRDEILEVVHGDHDKINGAILMLEEEKICSQQVLQSHEKFDTYHAEEGNNGLLIFPGIEVPERDTNLVADIADAGNISTAMVAGERGQRYDQHDGLTVENARGWEEDKALEPAQGKDKTEILMLEKETDAPRDVENDAATLAVAFDSVSSDKLPKQLTEEQENTPTNSQDHLVADMIKFESVKCESSAAQDPNLYLESAQGDSSQSEGENRFLGDLQEIEPSVQAIETREENVSSEPAREESENGIIESDTKPLNQSIGEALEEIEDTSATTEVDSDGVTGQMAMSEEDSMDDDTDEASIAEENSEGTGDSSAECNSEPIWPAESLEELSTDLTRLKFDNQIENKTLQIEGMYSNNVEDREISGEGLQNVNEGKDNMSENDQETNSLKPRILLDLKWTFMVLFLALLLLVFWFAIF